MLPAMPAAATLRQLFSPSASKIFSPVSMLLVMLLIRRALLRCRYGASALRERRAAAPRYIICQHDDACACHAFCAAARSARAWRHDIARCVMRERGVKILCAVLYAAPAMRVCAESSWCVKAAARDDVALHAARASGAMLIRAAGAAQRTAFIRHLFC